MALVLDFSIIAILFIGIWQFRDPLGAKHGNLTAAFALSLAFILVLYRNGVIDVATVVVSLLVGAIAGFYLARVVNMIQVPAMVAFQNGAGGVAAFLVSQVELTRTAHTLSLESQISGVLGLAIGAFTFSGSMVASAKLANKMRQSPQVLFHHNYFVFANGVALIGVGILSLNVPSSIATYLFILEILLGICFGILLSIRIGGADMPVLISSLNTTTGLAASLCGMVIESQLLIAFGATVAASGSILTYFMCKAMNRNIIKVIFPDYKPKKGSAVIPPIVATETHAVIDDEAWAVTALRMAKKVIIVPGYGMALAKAQEDVAALAAELMTMGKDVNYAIHPVAGRMPGHMNVLLAEVGVDYDMLVEMDSINAEFHTTDLVIIVGACDVVNPAAMEHEGTPISGMPILKAYEARKVICCNLDGNPGYSGVENPLYAQSNAVLLTGDAKLTVQSLLSSLMSVDPAPFDSSGADAADTTQDAIEVLTTAKNVVIIPGYGMALAKAQFKLVELAALLVQGGAQVKYAIHPVAGRMPGHMNVLLAEANVDYDDLLEMDEVNPLFAATDVALVVGACDVVNPAAIESEGTPISGMPILRAQDAKNIIVCNVDGNPGYSGVPNPLYANNKTILLLGDAKETTISLLTALQDKS
ncbi:NAD(P)(+) transhydrogenase (Re/Si-specific) subunit beta [uncultured Desulfuromusa sp.]|uniref:NAD(P)(+) transhydrogenase (Re/Si-specific) subunit beta n=1 Tax=uncultured Desulfuromusa sp. TaxID=219183 RepID=UPI002AA7BB57|nr:NAD(P)(+) transhydrogenase (Re/Si-specific) subunit beta [uncultured Desulfuromusa sp.]